MSKVEENPLIKAIVDGNDELSRDLITQGVDVNLKDIGGKTALMRAAINGNKEIIKLLIDAGADINQRTKRKHVSSYSTKTVEEKVRFAMESLQDGMTPLHFAATSGNEDAARLLIEKGADINIRDRFLRRTPLCSAAEHNNKTVAHFLVEKGADINLTDKYGRTPLFSLVENNNQGVAQLIIEKGADVNVADGDGKTPLYLAAAKGNEDIAQMLIVSGADVNVYTNDGKTPLHVAAENGTEDVLRLLIDKGADINLTDKYGRTPLFSLVEDNNQGVAQLIIEKGADVNIADGDGKTPLHVAAENGTEDVLRLLIDNGADINTPDRCGITPLFSSVKSDNKKASQLLIEKGADVNFANEIGTTPLCLAAALNNKDVSLYLIEKEADVNVCDKNQHFTPLYLATIHENEEIIRLLIEKGADVNTSDKQGRTSLILSAIYNLSITRLLIEKGADVNVFDEDGKTPLHFAAKKGNEDLARLLIEKGADVNTSDKDGRTPLFPSAENGSEGIAQLLIEQGADVNISDKHGRTSLIFSAANSNLSITRLLIEKGADVNVFGEDGKTPLHFAAKKGTDEDVARLLIEKGADVNTSDKDGRTPLFPSAEYGSEGVARLLIEKGADVNVPDEDGRTPLFSGVISNQESIVRLLIEKGADVDVSDKYGTTPLYLSASYNTEEVARLLISQGAYVNDVSDPLYRAVQNNNTELAQLLIENGADTSDDEYLRLAIQNDNNVLAQLFIEQGADVQVWDEQERSPLYFAAARSNIALVRLLIEKGADVNDFDENGESPLQMAASDNDNELVRLLIEKGADVNISDYFSKSPLGLAAKHNREESACLLIENGADVNVVDADGKKPLYYAAVNNNERVARLLISKGADVNESDASGRTLLFSVAEDDKYEEAARLLIEIGADVNFSDGKRQTSLHFAAANNSENVARLLIESGADMNALDIYKETPLFVAAQKHLDFALLLIEKGADIDEVTDKHGRTALFYLVWPYDQKQRVGGQPSNMKLTLTRKVALACSNINKRDNDGRTALSYAIETMNECEGYEPLARILIDAGANVNIADNKGQTPLFYAFTPSALRLLLDNGGDLTLRNNQKETVLIHAIEYLHNKDETMHFGRVDYPEGTRFNHLHSLINVASLEINAKDLCGRTAMIHAVMACNSVQEFKNMAGILVENGAVLNTTDSNDVSVLSYFIEKYCCDKFLQDEQNDIPATLTFLKANNSAVLHSILNYLYTILTKHPYNRNAAIKQKGTGIIENAISFVTKYASVRELEQIENVAPLLLNHEIPEAMEILFDLGVNPNSADSYGSTALHHVSLLPFSVHVCSQEIVMKILQTLEKHGVRFNAKDHKKRTPLHLCLETASRELIAARYISHESLSTVVEICEFLLKDGSLISEATRNGESVYHLILNFLKNGLSMECEDLRGGICSIAVQLLESLSKIDGEQSNVLKIADCNLNSPLHLWASLALPYSQNYEDNITNDLTFQMLLDTILQYLLKPGITPNSMNENDQTPLHVCETWTAVKLLLKAGAITNVVDKNGRTPLLNAAAKLPSRHIYPDVKEGPKAFFEKCASLNLEIWSSDNQGQSILSILLISDVYELANALIEIACESNPSVLKQLVDTICKDKSTCANWKSLLIGNILKSKRLPRPLDLNDALRCCIITIKSLHHEGHEFAFEDSGEILEPPVKKPRKDLNVPDIESPTSVHVRIARQLRVHGADGDKCIDLCSDFPELQRFLTTKIDLDDVPLSIPWTSCSKIHENKLARIARKQNVQKIGTYWFHEEPIGSGSFGHVFAGINEHDGREIAIKKIERLRMVRPEDKREITNLTALSDCPNIVNYIFFDDSDKDFVYIVLELMEGDLDEYFASCSFDVNRCATLCKDVVEGLAYLHQIKPKPILHRDLKPGNILYKLHPELCLKIADFGLSSPLTTTDGTTVRGTVVGTRCWIAPEVISSKPSYSQSSDVFACGLLLHYILSSQKHPFSPKDCTNKTSEVIDVETQSNMLKFEMEGWNQALSPEATHLIKGMLQQDNCKRPSITESLGHPFFWSNKKKIAFLSAVGNQHEFQCPPTIKAAAHCPTTGVEADLENSLASIVLLAKWDDPNYRDMTKVVTEMRTPIERFNKKGKTYNKNPRPYHTGSVVELVRFIRNAIAHVSESTRPRDIKKLILEDFVFLKEFPHLLIEVYKAVTAHGWGSRDEIKYAMITKD